MTQVFGPVLLLGVSGNLCQASGVDTLIQNFANSDFVFQRSNNNAPFPPLAYLSYYDYSDSEIRTANGASLGFGQRSLSQGLVFPWLITQRDAFFIGEWVSQSRFKTQSSRFESFDVVSAGIPLGWLRQVNPEWQAAAFIFPIMHNTNLDNAKTTYEFMGGAFARYVQTDDIWWGFGFFVDSDQGGDLYLPYVGVSWSLNTEWTLSAVMPWPAILYSPTPDTTFRFGAAPSGTSWVLDQAHNEIYYDWDNWNFGLSVEQRLVNNFWLQFEAGASGLHNLSISGSEWQSPDWKADSSGYLGISLNWRPSSPQ